MCVCIYIYISENWPRDASACDGVGGAAGDTGVCGINTHLDGAAVFNVPTPLP